MACQSRWTTPALQAPMLLLNPWRLTLLFFVSGAVSAHALRKFGAAGFARERSYRLALPLLFAIFVVVPLQSYAELWHKVDYRGDFLTFYVERYLTFGNLAPIYGPRPRVSICRPTTTCGSCCMCWPTRWWRPPCWQPGPVLEPALVTSLTLAGCWAAYALALRSGPLRPWLGLRPLPAAARARAETA